jgi:hypothetical protein
MADTDKTPPAAAPAQAPRPHRTAKGQLTRAGMEAALKAGGSVLHKGEILTDHHQLPAEADIVQGDAEASAALLASLDEQIAALSAQRNRLAKEQEHAKAEAKPEAAAEAPAAEDETVGDEPKHRRPRHTH